LRFSLKWRASTTQRRARHVELELGEVMDAVVVIAANQAGYFSLGAGRSIGIESMVGSRSFESWRLAPFCAHPTGPLPLRRTERFGPFWLLLYLERVDSSARTGTR
jgi:hypothetical protein